jgi:deazaflavin-dependent oxidoreductase (nitroreductase family)
MTSEKQIFDNPTSWVRDHIKTYVESEGQKGHRWRGLPTLLLTTRGRKTGHLRRTALIYGQDRDHYLVVASNGGATSHPLWYLNLVAHPEVEIQVGADKWVAHARTATAEEKPALWQVMSQIFPQYNAYVVKAAKAGREIPLIILEPVKHIEGAIDDRGI